MSRIRPGTTLSLFAVIVAVSFSFSVIATADAQERKSIRWATSSTGSYGYKVGAQMGKVFEDAFGGEYTVTVNPYPSTTAAMKAVMDGDGEVAYTADVGMTPLYEGEGAFKDYKPGKAKLVHTWYAYPMESFMVTYG
ncbi:MAG: immunogenic protein, partial [Deltaproteobacteria bacterium]|nr:immunogenic protein [Deltaproteobacteria bacterium]